MSRLHRRARPAHPRADLTVRSGQATRIGARVAGGVAVAVLASLAVAGCDGGPIAQDAPQSSGQSFVSGTGTTLYKAGSRPKAPDISGTTLAGQHLSLGSYRGSVVVINFWGSWCAPCRAEAPDLAALSARLKSRGVDFLGIDIQDTPATAEAFMHTFQISYPSLNDPGDELALAFRDTVPPAAIPSTLVIDRSGRIAARVVGSVSFDSLKPIITRIAAEHPAGATGAGQ